MRHLPVLDPPAPAPGAPPRPGRRSTRAPRPGGPLGWLSARVGRRGHRSFRVRFLIQAGFSLTCVLLGIQFARWVGAAQAGRLPLPARPVGAEAFLPLSGIMGALDWLHQGRLNDVHPAATVLVLLALVMAFVARKSFCSWVCPMGFLSDLLASFGRWSFGRNFRPWRWLDVPLRSLKYLLLAFFLLGILSMSPEALAAFIDAPYNRVADVKMGLFFTDLGRTATLILGGLLLGSVFVRGLWCRYLCPYGALLGLASWASPARVVRNADACTDCSLCDKVCPARIRVSAGVAVRARACTGCLDCVASCPSRGALEVRIGRRSVGPLAYAALVVGLFLTGYVSARAAGAWQNGIGDAEYVERIQDIHSSRYGHPGV